MFLHLILIYFFLTLNSTSSDIYNINSHSCNVKKLELKLECPYFGEGHYAPDRIMDGFKFVEFKYFGEGTIEACKAKFPQLEQIEVMSGSIACSSIKAEMDIKILIKGKLCQSTVSNIRLKY